jgi:hypothetical protein
MRAWAIGTMAILLSWAAFAQNPDCTGVDNFPTRSAFVSLKNAYITDNYKVDFTKTKTVRLASEKIGKDLYRQVHHVTFVEKSGTTIEVITVNNASNAECSESAVDVYVISKHLGGAVKGNPRSKP